MKKSKCWLMLHALALLTLMAAYKQAEPLPGNRPNFALFADGFVLNCLGIAPFCLYLFLMIAMLRRTP